MANYDFKQDLPVGEKGEDVVVYDLGKLNAKLVAKNDDYRYDLLMEINKKQITYEVKTDVYCKPEFDTLNLFVEFESRGKPSGIEVTQAKWFVTYFKHLKQIWYIKTDDLKKLIRENEFRQTEFSGDAGSNTKGYLIPRYDFIKKFIVRNTY